MSLVLVVAEILHGVENSKTGHLALATPLSGNIFHRQGGTCYGKSMYQIWSLQVHPLRSYERRCKMQKMGWFWMVRGHSKSWAMPPFDTVHMTSYSTLIETMRLSFTVFEILPVICRKLPILTHPTCIWPAPPQGVIAVEFCGDLWHQITTFPGLSCGVMCVILRLAVLVEHRLVTDRHRQTQAHG